MKGAIILLSFLSKISQTSASFPRQATAHFQEDMKNSLQNFPDIRELPPTTAHFQEDIKNSLSSLDQRKLRADKGLGVNDVIPPAVYIDWMRGAGQSWGPLEIKYAAQVYNRRIEVCEASKICFETIFLKCNDFLSSSWELVRG